MPTKPSMASLLIILLLVALLASLAGNAFLFKQAKTFYARIAEIRLDPINTQRFAAANAELLSRPKTQPRIVIFGESRCGQWEAHHPDNWGPVEIVNRGIGGETTPQIKARLQSDVLALKPDLVILQMGDNDLKTMAMLPHRKQEIIQETLANILEIAETIKASGAQVLLTTIFPTDKITLVRSALWSPEVNDSIDYVNQQLLAYQSPGISPVDCDAFLRDGRYIKTEYALDTLHLTAAGYQALNQELEATVKRLLSR